MKLKKPTRGSDTSLPVTALSVGSTICAQPWGRPASARISSKVWQLSGVLAAGLTTTGALTAMAGTT
ncbi:hypothetical protein D3C85_1746590 [compost metagenome]